jgi:hypothetical protein
VSQTDPHSRVFGNLQDLIMRKDTIRFWNETPVEGGSSKDRCLGPSVRTHMRAKERGYIARGADLYTSKVGKFI